MGERKGQNHYYPPDFDPKKHGNLNAYHGTHALRERARKLDQGILIIRFEMPYNIWCDGCKAHIAMGVRYNAQKSKAGMYYTTPIHHFRMKCHLCPQHFEIQTDPANMDYVILSGARRKEQRWDMADNEQIVTEEKSDIKKLAADPMFKLEHDSADRGKAAPLMPTLRELEAVQAQWQDDFGANSLMRSQLREEKRAAREQADSDRRLLDKWNINVELVREHEDDRRLAALFKFESLDSAANDKDFDEESRKLKRRAIEAESIFDGTKSAKKRTLSLENSSRHGQVKSLAAKLRRSVQEKRLAGSDLAGTSLFSLGAAPKSSPVAGKGLVSLKKSCATSDTSAKGGASTSLVEYAESGSSDGD